jgi:Icc-related predicted phosphoesterase
MIAAVAFISLAILSLNNAYAFKIVTVGDLSCDRDSLQTMTNIINYLKENKVDRFVFLGDIDYGPFDAGQDYFQCSKNFLKQTEKYTELRMVKGNHEFTNVWGNLTKDFNAKNIWSDKFGNVLLVGIDTEQSWENQYEQVKDFLNQTASKKFVFMHKPALPETCLAKPLGEIIKMCGFFELYHPLFLKEKVDCVIQAHIHTFALFNHDGICYNIYGMGGAERSTSVNPAYSNKTFESELNGFVVIEDNNHIFYANNGSVFNH